MSVYAYVRKYIVSVVSRRPQPGQTSVLETTLRPRLTIRSSVRCQNPAASAAEPCRDGTQIDQEASSTESQHVMPGRLKWTTDGSTSHPQVLASGSASVLARPVRALRVPNDDNLWLALGTMLEQNVIVKLRGTSPHRDFPSS